MDEEQKPTQSTDTVSGEKATSQQATAMDGIEELKRQLESSEQKERIKALKQAVKYGDEGLKLIQEASSADRQKLAEHPRTSVKIYRLLAKDENREVRDRAIKKLQQIAEYRKTSKALLQQLARDENGDVRGGVAQNIYTPREALQQLALDQSKVVCSLAIKTLRQKGLR